EPRVLQPMHRQPLIFLPTLHSADFAPQIGSDFLPRFELVFRVRLPRRHRDRTKRLRHGSILRKLQYIPVRKRSRFGVDALRLGGAIWILPRSKPPIAPAVLTDPQFWLPVVVLIIGITILLVVR